MDIHESKGWKNRRRLADMKRADWQDDERAAVRAERERMKQEADAANRAAVEATEAALASAQCRCVACGGTGFLPVEKAAGIVEAMYHYGFQSYKPSKATVAALDAIARGVEGASSSPLVTFAYGSISPAPAVAVASDVPATVAVMIAPKPAKPTKVERIAETYDGALIETD